MLPGEDWLGRNPRADQRLHRREVFNRCTEGGAVQVGSWPCPGTGTHACQEGDSWRRGGSCGQPGRAGARHGGRLS